VVVPGLAFTPGGHRLGYGGGYYDRLLCRRSCPAVGLAFESQVVPGLPLHPGDEALDAIATEKRVIIPRKH
jgi:5-formyltetrahydrofolate cyclo-ligase